MIDYPWLYSNMSQKNTAHNLGPFRVDEIVNDEIIEKFQFLWQFIKKPLYLQLPSTRPTVVDASTSTAVFMQIFFSNSLGQPPS